MLCHVMHTFKFDSFDIIEIFHFATARAESEGCETEAPGTMPNIRFVVWAMELNFQKCQWLRIDNFPSSLCALEVTK